MAAKLQAQVIRDNYRMYLLDNSTPVDRGYHIDYAKNLRGMTWTEDASNVVTAILPTGKKKNGEILFHDTGEGRWFYADNAVCPYAAAGGHKSAGRRQAER